MNIIHLREKLEKLNSIALNLIEELEIKYDSKVIEPENTDELSSSMFIIDEATEALEKVLEVIAI